MNEITFHLLFYFAIRLFLSNNAVFLTLPRSGVRLPRGRGKYPEEEVDRKTRNLNTVVHCIYLRSSRRKILSRKVFSFALVKSPSRNGGITLRGVRISFLAFPASSLPASQIAVFFPSLSSYFYL